MKTKFFSILFVILLINQLGCQIFPPRIYKMDLQQGILYPTKKIKKIKPGLHRSEVQALLGKPLLKTSMQNKQWYYIYTKKTCNQTHTQLQKLIICFKNNHVTSIKHCKQPAV